LTTALTSLEDLIPNRLNPSENGKNPGQIHRISPTFLKIWERARQPPRSSLAPKALYYVVFILEVVDEMFQYSGMDNNIPNETIYMSVTGSNLGMYYEQPIRQFKLRMILMTIAHLWTKYMTCAAVP
jgi:hypothetical protein